MTEFLLWRMMSPRGYISASQIRTFKKSKEDYLRRYVYGEDIIPHFVMKYVDFGKDIHQQIENEELEPLFWDIDTTFTDREKELTPKLGEIPLKGYIDAINTDERIVADSKTSKNPKTQSWADKNEQLTFYAVMCDLEYGWIPELIIYWIETTEENGYLELSGKVKEIKTTRTKKQVEDYKKEIKTIWKEIGKLVDAELEADEYLGGLKNYE